MKAVAKFLTAVVGAGVTSALTIWGPETGAGRVLVVISAVLTAVGVWAVPNVAEEE